MAEITYFNMGPWPVYVGFTTSPKAFKREMDRLGITDQPFHASRYANATTHFLENRDQMTAVITMTKPKGIPVEQVAGLIAHEATHVAQAMWEQLGEREPGHEAEAYLVQHIVQGCLQEALKTGREKKTEP